MLAFFPADHKGRAESAHLSEADIGRYRADERGPLEAGEASAETAFLEPRRRARPPILQKWGGVPAPWPGPAQITAPRASPPIPDLWTGERPGNAPPRAKQPPEHPEHGKTPSDRPHAPPYYSDARPYPHP